MLKELRIFLIIFLVAATGFMYRTIEKHAGYSFFHFILPKNLDSQTMDNGKMANRGSFSANTLHFLSKNMSLQTMDNGKMANRGPISANAVLSDGNGILFVETTDRMDPPSLVLCAVESAARVYPDRPVVFFMKGLKDIVTKEDEKREKEHFPTLASYDNVYLLPLRMDELFDETPLKSWYDKVDPNNEVYWTHVKSDACRFAMMWKYGGIYMDADVISLRPIPNDHFMAAETFKTTSSSVFGFSPHYQLTWQFMKNFVENYRGEIWGHQGPGVFTRVVTEVCGMPEFTSTDDVMCRNISYFHPQRFYPILYPAWRRYFDVWQDLPTFNDSYALHLWNFMNKEGKAMVPGSNTLVEHLYRTQCPNTYGYISRNEKTHV